MAEIRYFIRRLSVAAMLSYAKPMGNDIYSFDLTEAQTASVLMGNGETWQEDSAIFFQTMCVLHGNEYEQPTEDTVISDLCDVMLYLDFSGIQTEAYWLLSNHPEILASVML